MTFFERDLRSLISIRTQLLFQVKKCWKSFVCTNFWLGDNLKKLCYISIAYKTIYVVEDSCNTSSECWLVGVITDNIVLNIAFCQSQAVLSNNYFLHQNLSGFYCRFMYRKTLLLKPWKEWCLPELHLSFVDVLELLFDAFILYRMKFVHTINRPTSVVGGIIRTFYIFHRFGFYVRTFSSVISSFFSVVVIDAV